MAVQPWSQMRLDRERFMRELLSDKPRHPRSEAPGGRESDGVMSANSNGGWRCRP